MVGSLLWGVKVLTFFGISIYAVQIGGGLVVAITGWSLLARDSDSTRSKDAQGTSVLDRAFYPYTMPAHGRPRLHLSCDYARRAPA